MNVALEDVLNPLYEVELASYMSDFDKNLTPKERERESHTEILTASLQTIKSFISILTAQFFEQDNLRGAPSGAKSGKQGKGKSKDAPKRGTPEE